MSLDRLREITRAIKALYRPGDMVEVRAFDKNGGKFVSRYPFNERGEELAAAIAKEDEAGRDTYYVCNPTSLSPVDVAIVGTKEKDIIQRRWVLLDFDPVRLYKIATEEQHAAALTLARTVKTFLIEEGWSGLFLASSGNGIHLLIPVDLPVDEAAKKLVRCVQRAIADKFETPDVEIECFPDANRLIRAYGTTNHKADETDILKWRTSEVIEANDVPPPPITWEQLETFAVKYSSEAAKIAEPEPRLPEGGGTFTYEDLEKRLESWARNNPDFAFEPGRVSKGDGRGFYIRCPGDLPGGWGDGAEHTDCVGRPNSSMAVWIGDGYPRFRCGHSHCDTGAKQGKKTWKDLENFFDPGKLQARGGDVYVGSARAAGGPSGGATDGSSGGATDDRSGPATPGVKESIDEVKQRIRALLFSTPKQRRDSGLPSSEKEMLSALADLIWHDLEKRGRVFNNGGLGYVLLEDHIPIAVSSDGKDFGYIMSRDYLLKAGEKAKDYVGRHVGVMCCAEGETIDLRLSTHFERDTNSVYVAEKRGWMLRITKDSITRLPNGTDDQVFLFPKNYEGFTLDVVPNIMESPLSIPASIDNLLFSGMTFAESALRLEDKKTLVVLYLITLWMRGIVQEKVLFTLLGPTGSGKTYLLRLMGKFLQGKDFEVSGAGAELKEIENALVNNPFVVFDELDFIPNDIRALIRRAVTGGKMQRRELYTTNEQVEIPYRAFISCSTQIQPFDSEEDTNRQLAFSLEARPKGNYVDETELITETMKYRDWFLSHMVSRTQLVLKALDNQRGRQIRVNMRLAGFATLLIRLKRFRAEDQDKAETEARGLLDRWASEQESRLFESNDLAESLGRFVNTSKRGQRMTAGELLGKLVAADFITGKPWWATEPKRLASVLLRSSGALKRRFGMTIEMDRHRKTNLYSFEPPDLSAVAPTPDKPPTFFEMDPDDT